jgi:hypothetical protein
MRTNIEKQIKKESHTLHGQVWALIISTNARPVIAIGQSAAVSESKPRKHK